MIGSQYTLLRRPCQFYRTVCKGDDQGDDPEEDNADGGIDDVLHRVQAEGREEDRRRGDREMIENDERHVAGAVVDPGHDDCVGRQQERSM